MPRAPVPPRSTFSSPEAPKRIPAFPGESDKTVKRPYPLPPEQGLSGELESDSRGVVFPEERTVRVERSAFAATLIDAAAPEARVQAARPAASTPSAAPGKARPPAAPEQDPHAEPLRVPSQRPVPAPYEQARNVRADRTLLMPGTMPEEAQSRPVDKMTPVVPYTGGPHKGSAPAQAQAEPAASPVRMRSTTPVGAPPAAATPQRESVRAPTATISGAPPAAKPVASAPPPPAAPAPRARTSAAAEPRRPTNSEPIRLKLDAGDVLPELATTARPAVPQSRMPWVAAVVAIVITLGALALWLQSRPKSATAPAPHTVVDGARSSAVPAAPATPALTASPTPPQAAPAAEAPAASAKPAAAAAAPAQPAEPANARPVEAPAAAAAKAPQPVRQQAPASSARAQAPAKSGSAARSHAAAAQPRPAAAPGAASEDIESARAALKSLESGSEISIKPSEGSSGDAPLAPPGDGVMKLSPKANPPPPENEDLPPPAPANE